MSFDEVLDVTAVVYFYFYNQSIHDEVLDLTAEVSVSCCQTHTRKPNDGRGYI